MRHEDEPVLPEEALLRLIWCDYFKPDLALIVQPAAFEPRKNENDGISVFRSACLKEARDILAVIAEEKRSRYAIAMLSVTDVLAIGLTIQPAKIVTVAGHTVLPELSAIHCKDNKVRCRTLQKQLAEIASRNVVHRPGN